MPRSAELEAENCSGDRLRRLVSQLGVQQRETLRGICSLWHNQSTDVGAGGDNSARIALSKKSEWIAIATSDEYRLGQALHQQARLWSKDDPEKSRQIWNRILASVKWERGKLMARQQLALLDGNPGFASLGQSIEQLFKLIDDIQERQHGATLHNDALDVDLYGWTVQETFKRMQQLTAAADTRAEPVHLDDLWDRMLIELREMVEAYRRVVKVSTYKHAFAKYYAWAYDRLTWHFLKRGDSPHAFYFAESSSARDILDLLAEDAGTIDVAPVATAGGAAPGDAPATVEFDGAPTEPRWRHGLQQVDDGDNQVRRAVATSYRNFEAYVQEHPSTPIGIDDNIFDTTLEFTKRQSDFALCRFVVEGRDGNGVATSFGVFRFHQGKFRYFSRITVGGSLARFSELLDVDALIALPQEKRFDEFCARLAGLSHEIGKEILEPALGDLFTANYSPLVVFVPSDSVFRLPLHIGRVGANELLAVRSPTVYATSAAAIVIHGRLGRAFAVAEPDDILGVVSTRDETRLLGEEALGPLARSQVAPQRVYFAGPDSARKDYPQFEHIGPSTVDIVRQCLGRDPHWLLISAHGKFVSDDKSNRNIHSYLCLPEDSSGILTPYDLATTQNRMTRNRLTMLAACVTGYGADLDGGEVSGFLRSLISAGAGACALTLWPVEEHAVRHIVREALVTPFGAAQGGSLPHRFQRVYANFSKKILAMGWPEGATESYCSFGLYV